ncbi:hypothetical protein [Brevibacterium otitidis]|uniref:Uncharacterized protein n=1 Tax=Brevibacterium otitidis TaxID=53364 RepID=A0ABV5X4Q5_9MICO|nr:hypothetical protein GCM10023233_32960 [Brevibacterium otitidis]
MNTTTNIADELRRELTARALRLWDNGVSPLTPRQGSMLSKTISLWIDEDLADALSNEPTFDIPWNERGLFAFVDDMALVTIGDGVKPFIRQTQRACRTILECLDRGETPLNRREMARTQASWIY